MPKFLQLSRYNDESNKYFLNVDHIESFQEGQSTSLPNTEIMMSSGHQYFVAEPPIHINRMIYYANQEEDTE